MEPSESRRRAEVVALGKQIKAERAAAGLTLEELGKLVGVHKNTLLNYEKGEREIPFGALADLARVLGIDAASTLIRAAEERASRDI